MKSICIKTISKEKVNFLIEQFEKIPINIYMSNYRFKVYDNVIIHYAEENIEQFYDFVSEIIKKCIETNKPHKVFIYKDGKYEPMKECPYEK